MSKKDRYLSMTERFSKMLLSEATGGKIGGFADLSDPKIDFKDRRALLDTMIKLIHEKNKHGEDDDDGEFSNIKKDLYDSGTLGGGATDPDTGPTDE